MSNIWKHAYTTVAGFVAGGGVWSVLHASCGVSTWQQYLVVAAPIVLGAFAKDPSSK